MNLPGNLNQAIAEVLKGQGSLRQAAHDMSGAYRQGASSGQVRPEAYLVARLPATYAACLHVLSSISDHLKPQSLLDIGTGPGTAAWASLATWPDLAHITQVEPDPDFASMASRLNAGSGLVALTEANIRHVPMAKLGEGVTADLVTASYVFAELPESESAELAIQLWSRAGQMMVLLEPGTPRGFARIRAVRMALLKAGASVVAPCCHSNACPIQDVDWCHFKVRVQRSRAHMHVKQAQVPFEDEAFSYLVVSRQPVHLGTARILGSPRVSKADVTLRLCSSGAIERVVVARRDAAAYKEAKRAAWGDVWPRESRESDA